MWQCLATSCIERARRERNIDKYSGGGYFHICKRAYLSYMHGDLIFFFDESLPYWFSVFYAKIKKNPEREKF